MGDISGCCRQPRSSEGWNLFGQAGRNDVVPSLQTSRHSSVRSERAPFLRPGQNSRGRRAERRSRAAVRPARQRVTLDGHEHDGSLAISPDCGLVRRDPGSIDAVERFSACRANVAASASGQQCKCRSLGGLRHRGVQAIRHPGALDTRDHARRKRWRAARSVKEGAMGLMQIMPGTWTELRSRYRLGVDPYDVRDNILAGAAYIRELSDRYGAPGFLAAYNAGPGRYERHLATGRPLPDETQAYVATLAPMITRARTNVQLGAVARSFAWANSSLFASRSAGISSDRSSLTDMRQNRSSRAHGVVDLSAFVPHSGNLFVHRTGEMRSR